MTGELITVKEYAARQGMTEQAAYKQIRAGKLLTVERQENGKAKKYIFVFAQEYQGTPADAAGAPDQNPEPAPDQTCHAAALDQTVEAGPGSEAPAQDKTGAALEKAVAALTAQLEEKDRQINRLTELLSQSHQLQAHSQKLLEQGTTQPPERNQDEPEKEPEEPKPQGEPEQPKKRSFWEWLSSI